MSPRMMIFIGVLTAAAAGTWYLARDKSDGDIDVVPYDSTHRGYYLNSARILGTADDGSLLYEIEAEHAEQEASDRIEFKEVRIR